MTDVQDPVISAIYDVCESRYKEECCGIVTNNSGQPYVVPLDNHSPTPATAFRISSMDFMKYCSNILFVFHSHPDRPATLSKKDIASSNAMKKPVMAVSWPMGDLAVTGEAFSRKPLSGRPFIYGFYDCFSLARDYYLEILNIKLPQFVRPRYGWWMWGESPFINKYETAGFHEVDSPADGDLVIMKLPGATVPNHIGVYTRNNLLLHHKLGCLSTEVVYDHSYQSRTVKVLRHADRG